MGIDWICIARVTASWWFVRTACHEFVVTKHTLAARDLKGCENVPLVKAEKLIDG